MPYPDTIQPDWTEVNIENFAGGINTFLSATALQKNELLDCLNARVVGDKVVGDTGYFATPVDFKTIPGPEGNYIGASLGGPISYFAIPGQWVLIRLADGVTEYRVQIDQFYYPFSVYWVQPNDIPQTVNLTGATIFFGQGLYGVPIADHQLILSDGTTKSFMFTNKGLYVPTDITSPAYLTGQWIGLSTGTVGNYVGNPTYTADNIDIDDITGFNIGDTIRVRTAAYGYWHSHIIAITPGVAPAGNLQFEDFLPAALVTNGEVVQCVQFNATVNDRFSIVSVPWADQMIFTNGVDPIRLYDDSTQLVTNLTGLPAGGDTQCKALAVYDNSIFLINTTEATINYAQRIRWSDVADITNWSTGDSGYIDLYDNGHPLVAGKLLNSFLFLYKTKGIYRCAARLQSSTGTIGAKRFDFDPFITDRGALTLNAVVAIDDSSHMVMDDDNIWIYGGDFNITPVGHQIKSILYGSLGALDKAYLDQITMFKLYATNEIYIIYQHTDDTVPRRAVRFHITEQKWSRREFQDGIYGHLVYETLVASTWNDMTWPWDAGDAAWNAQQFSGGNPKAVIYGGADDVGSVFNYAATESTDNGKSIVYEIVTKEFEDNPAVRHDSVEFDVTGDVNVLYSSDKGSSYSDIGSCNCTDSDPPTKFYRQFIAGRYRYKLTGTAPGFRLHSAKIRIQPESEY